MSNRTQEMHKMFQDSEVWETLANVAQWVRENVLNADALDSAEVEHEEGLITWGNGEIGIDTRHMRVFGNYEKDKYGRVEYWGQAVVEFEDTGDYEDSPAHGWLIARLREEGAMETFKGNATSLTNAIIQMWWLGLLVQRDVKGFIR